MKAAAIVLGILAAVNGVLLVLADRRISELEAEKASLESEFFPKIAVLEAKVSKLEVKRTYSESAAKEQEHPDGIQSGKGGAASSNPMEGFADMMNQPGMQTMIEQQTRTMASGIYGDLLKDLGLDEDTEAELKELVTKKAAVAASIGFRLMDKSLDSEGRKNVAYEVKQEMDRLTEASRELLSEEQFDQLKLFEASQPDRQALQMFKGSLGGDVADLSYEQEEQMIALMYEERSNFDYSTGDFSNQMEFDPDNLANFNSETVETYIEETQQLHNSINARAGDVLDDAQLEAFRASQEAYLQMQSMGMRMGAQMMGSQPE